MGWKEYRTTGGQYLEYSGSTWSISIETRPTYCDRGNYLAKVHGSPPLENSLDSADGWPRYYMDLDRAKAEIEAWLTKRKWIGG